MIHLDHGLITDAQILANGRYVHKVANFIAAYRSAYGFYLDNPDDDSIKLLQETEKQLIKFISRRRREKYSNDKDIQRDIENIKPVRKSARRVAEKK